MKALKEGVLLSTRLASLEERDDDSARFVAQGALAEALGFDSVWVGDSLVARPRLEPIAPLGALAARTSRIMLGTAVFLPAIRHPVQRSAFACNNRLPLARSPDARDRHGIQIFRHRTRAESF